MKWILHLDVVCLYLNEKISASNPFGMTQVYISLYTHTYVP